MADKTPSLNFVPRHRCQLCGSSDSQPIASWAQFNLEFHWVICRCCTLIYMNPVPDEASYLVFYADSFWQMKTDRSDTVQETKIEYQRRLRVPRVDRLLRNRLAETEACHVLEVGCAWGETLAHIHRTYAARVFGVEPSTSARQHLAKERAEIQLIGSSIEDIRHSSGYDGRMDIVIFSHVLENISDQNAALDTARRLLADDGTLYIDTPNFFYHKSLNPYHPFIYTPYSLPLMLSKHGFAVELQSHAPAPSSSLVLTLLRFLIHREPYLTLRARKLPPSANEPTGYSSAADAASIASKREMGMAAMRIAAPFLKALARHG